MLHGAQLAIDEANARGGYGGKPFRLMIHNDAATWGASSNEIVKMIYDEKVWAMLGSISGDSTHIALRVSLRAELPIVNSAATDPTIPETVIPWILTTIQDDRVQGYTLARRIYTDLGLKRIGLLRVNERYGRFGVLKFRDASRRLGHPVVIEQKFEPWKPASPASCASSTIRAWMASCSGRMPPPAGTILKEMREMGMKQPVFGGARVVGDGSVAHRAARAPKVWKWSTRSIPTATIPPGSISRSASPPLTMPTSTLFSALGFDTMNILLQSICRAGLNRGRIRDALYSLESYKGVTGEMIFDPNAKNIAPLYLGKVKDGQLTLPPLHHGEAVRGHRRNGVGYAGPPLADASGPEFRIGLFGPGAEGLAASLASPGYRLSGVSSDVSWGKASTALVKLVYDPAVLGIVATDRNSAHLAEQIAVKTFLPVIAISSDRTLTSANVPWIFRLPAGTSPADAVRCLAAAARQAGPNRERIRDMLASGKLVWGQVSFHASGEPQ